MLSLILAARRKINWTVEAQTTSSSPRYDLVLARPVFLVVELICFCSRCWSKNFSVLSTRFVYIKPYDAMSPRPREDSTPTPTPPPSSLPGLWKYPTYRDVPIKSAELWLRGKQIDDGAEGLWRIHDSLYDLSQWVNNHPGGADWLNWTKGTDITEAFEAHHIFETADRLLPLFYVRPAATRRNSPYTFAENGFYKTLKSKVRESLRGASTGPTAESKLIADGLVISTFMTAVLAASLGSYTLAAVSGILLCCGTICAHNFFHQKDNFRMYYFDLSLLSSRDWRISHAMSHHLYPNSLHDLEISMFEPFLQWLPKEKTFWERYGSWFYSPILYSGLFHIQFILKMVLAVKGYWSVLRWSDLIAFSMPMAMTLYGGCNLFDAVLMWTWIIAVSSFSFGVIGINGGHHHPDIFHDGDTPRADLDWGLQQLDAVRDRKGISANLFLVLTNFGHHSLHHLFPTVDHSRLPPLYPLLEETCRQFGIDYQQSFTSTVYECLKGQFVQLIRDKPNPVAPGSAAQAKRQN